MSDELQEDVGRGLVRKGEGEVPTSGVSPRDARGGRLVFFFSISLSLRDSPRGVFVTNKGEFSHAVLQQLSKSVRSRLTIRFITNLLTDRLL